MPEFEIRVIDADLEEFYFGPYGSQEEAEFFSRHLRHDDETHEILEVLGEQNEPTG